MSTAPRAAIDALRYQAKGQAGRGRWWVLLTGNVAALAAAGVIRLERVAQARTGSGPGQGAELHLEFCLWAHKKL